MSVAMMPEDRTVTVVGQVYEYPLKPFPYPNTFAERQKAPWPWQMALAMDNLWWEMVRGGDAGLLYDYARELPCSAADDARFFAKLTAAVAEHRREVPPRDIVGAWRNLIRRGLAEAQPFMYSAGLREDTDDSWWAAHLLLLEEARRDLIYQSGFWSNSLRKRYRSNQGSYTEVEGRVPRTLAYELARRAARNDKIRDYERAVAGAAAASMFGETIFPYEDTLIDERRPAAVARVVKWFDAREADLRAGAEAEAPALAAAEERFASALCRK
jgi:hypothetical protein